MAGFPKSVRILRSSEFRTVYERGSRYPGASLLAFVLLDEAGGGPKVGITVPRSLGKAVVRNRIKRRIREAVRSRLSILSPQCRVVINPRRRVLTAPFSELEREIESLFLRSRGPR
ncbi:MAG: ribonuclease P protein component [Bryobacterales bacterium]|nr:ribonuclease P protein component [Bryobacterales bacterium]